MWRIGFVADVATGDNTTDSAVASAMPRTKVRVMP